MWFCFLTFKSIKETNLNGAGYFQTGFDPIALHGSRFDFRGLILLILNSARYNFIFKYLSMKSFCVKPRYLLALFICHSFASSVQAQCTSMGAFSGTSFSDDNSVGVYAFSSPSSLGSSDNARATAAAIIGVLSGNTHYLKSAGFGFAIPGLATICGISVEVEKSASNISMLATVSDNAVRLTKATGLVGNDYASTSDWTTTDQYYTYGGPDDLWGTSWTPAEINAPSFGLAFSARISGIVSLLPVARIDHVRITVYYFVILPVVFSSFSAESDGKANHLSWTAFETSNAERFEIERSVTGDRWETIARVSPQSMANARYRYTDKPVASCMKLRYRIKAVDRAGNANFSQVAVVLCPAENSFMLYPNPAENELYISRQQIGTCRIYTLDGKELNPEKEKVSAEKIRVNIAKLASGVYIIEVDKERKLFYKN